VRKIEINSSHAVSCTSFGNGWGTRTTDDKCDECGEIVLFEWTTPAYQFTVDEGEHRMDTQNLALTTGGAEEIQWNGPLDPLLEKWLDHTGMWDEFNDWKENDYRPGKKT